MSRLVRLYPQQWRDRYGAELADLLEARPSTLGDTVDMVRGAADAHLHPHLVDGSEPAPWTHRIPGLLALSAGLVWALIVARVAIADAWDAWNLVGVVALLIFLSLPGDYMAAHGRRIALALGSVAGWIVLARLLPWEVGSALGLLAVVVILGGPLSLAAIRAGVGVRRRWLLFALTVGVQVLASIPFSVGLMTMSEPWTLVGVMLLLAPYGLGWILVGIRLTVRGSPTFITQPPAAPGPEASVA